MHLNQNVIQNSFFYKLLVLNCIVVINNKILASASYDYDYNLDSGAIDMIKRAGYPAESHFVTTQDGYILEMHRIPSRVNGSSPVFLQHELFGCSNLWLFAGKNFSLPYHLADAGYDVWMGNNRGTSYGKAHVNKSTKDPEFWTFSQHEIGVYDLFAEISYVANFTSQSVIFTGFSMGPPVALIMASQRLNIQSKIRLMIHLAPAVFMKNMAPVPIKFIAQFSNQIKILVDFLGIHEVPPAYQLIRVILKYSCTLSAIQENICKEILMLAFGIDSPQFSRFMVPMLTNYIPDTTSTMVLMHYAQWIQSGHFQQYDYGKTKNLEIYNQTTPPDYDITKINIPNVIFYAEADWYADTKDVFKLYDYLPNKAGLIKVNYTEFSHLDFRVAIDAPTSNVQKNA
ncbi:hypothetical protein PV325_013227 [Microctonus aethiopoides]|nr:hypothetical protein PV325_013227 [Microctonus aethiopoides]